MPRTAQPRRYLMCRPTHFTVNYEINPWMDATRPVDTALALAQWERLRDVYVDLGHTVEEIDPVPGLPDMVYAANGAAVVDGVVYSARFRFPERRDEAPAYLKWFVDRGYATSVASARNEGQGDFLLAGDVVLAGTGTRTSRAAHEEAARVWGATVVGLNLVDPRYYHLDTALTVLRGGGTVRDPAARTEIAYYPPAFDDASLDLLRYRFPDAVIATGDDAAALGLNAVSDGRHVVVAPRATHLAGALAERGYEVIGVDTAELLRGGGGAKCCTLEIGEPSDAHPGAARAAARAGTPAPLDPAGAATPAGRGAAVPAGRRADGVSGAAGFAGREHIDAGGTPAHRPSALVHNYSPLPVTIATADGSRVTDTAGREYLDLLSGYSALNFGHRNPVLLAAARDQLDRVTLTSRAFGHDLLEPFTDRLAALIGPLTRGGATGTAVLPMNTGAEAVESAIKAARKWAYDVRGIPPEQATIVVAAGNFHGRTTTIVSFSDDDDARRGFGPYTPGFRLVPFGDAAAVSAAIDDSTAAVLMEPIQGESGVNVPPEGFWPALRTLCDDREVLLVADEIQSGLGRTGTTLATEVWGVRADLVTLGKALGGGIVPVSAVVGRADVLDVLTPGTHGSTFGGNPLACAVGLAVVGLLETGEPQAAARALGTRLHPHLHGLVAEGLLTAARGVGAWAGIDVPHGTGRELCEALLARGVLAKDTHGATVRLAPPLTMTAEDLDLALDALTDALRASA